MKALIDTNIIIDALQSREDFLVDSREILLRAGDYDGYVVASSITDIFYLQKRFYHDKRRVKEALADLLRIYDILDTTARDCRNALRSNVVDFEDAVLIEVAMRAKIDAIVTRNPKDFADAPMKVCTPTDFLKIL